MDFTVLCGTHHYQNRGKNLRSVNDQWKNDMRKKEKEKMMFYGAVFRAARASSERDQI